LASQIDLKSREAALDAMPPVPDQVMVCLSSRGPNSELLLRYGSRLAGRFSRNWYAVYVQTPREASTVIDPETQRLIANTLTIAKQLGATAFTYKGEDVADTILRFAKEYRVGHIVVGSPTPPSIWKRITGKKSLVHRLIDKARDAAVVVIDTTSQPRTRIPVEITGENIPVKMPPPSYGNSMSRLLGRNILFWEDPVSKEEVIRALVHVACRGLPGCDETSALKAVIAREAQGSTFLNEGLAIPHARLKNVHAPGVALGIVRGGITGNNGGSVGYIVLSLTPDTMPEVQVDILASIFRMFQDRLFLKAMDSAVTLDDVREALASWTSFQGNTT
ncbi:MAG: PTS sugar transporter subunit IIA, partial [Syntrophorhabdus sp.]